MSTLQIQADDVSQRIVTVIVARRAIGAGLDGGATAIAAVEDISLEHADRFAHAVFADVGQELGIGVALDPRENGSDGIRLKLGHAANLMSGYASAQPPEFVAAALEGQVLDGSRRSIPARCARHRVAQQSADKAFVHRLERNDMLAVGQHHPTDGDLVHLSNVLTDHGQGVVADLAVRALAVGADQVAGIDVGPVDELVDLDGTCRFERDLLELLFRDLDVLTLLERVTPAMSSFGTSSPVSASTFTYLMRCPVWRLKAILCFPKRPGLLPQLARLPSVGDRPAERQQRLREPATTIPRRGQNDCERR
ncbi:hypothetical protein I6F21_19710 [Bradyrhizobium sp. NBAIM03]|nr:hypothetical protein [Bradyrhizobium sp. NBAIM03]